VKLQVFDANGFPVAGTAMGIAPQRRPSFRLPDNAVAGGYELRFTYGGDAIAASAWPTTRSRISRISVLPSQA
jgi:uncharacterized protein YfaS (alpha-2-macroglobulin family)